MHQEHFTVDSGVTHERVDDEVLAVHLSTGLYYSLIGVAADCWAALAAGATVDSVAEALLQLPHTSRDAVTADVRRFLDALLSEQLLSPCPSPTNGAVAVYLSVDTYAAPELERHGDLQELLMIDPIHDVSDEGWPALPT